MTRRRHGFTLVEMIVAGFILSIAVVAAMSAFSTVTRVNGKAEVMQTSGLLARQHFSELEQQVDSLSGGDQQGDFGSDYAGYRWQRTVEATDYPNLFKVVLTISWGSGPRTEQYEYTTFLRTDQNVTDQQIRDQQSTTQGSTGGTSGG
jgi:prepilin-type N-terminal cleavage/methylation domain-containing protein